MPGKREKAPLPEAIFSFNILTLSPYQLHMNPIKAIALLLFLFSSFNWPGESHNN